MLVFSVGYWVLVVIATLINAFVVPTFEEVGHLERGCYITDAMLLYVKCRGFFGAQLVGWILTLPFNIAQVVWIAVSPMFWIGIPLAALLWAPLVYPFIHRRLQRGAT